MKKVLVVLGILAFSSGGCAALFGKKMHTVSLQSSPGDADVYVDGMLRGRTPLMLELQPNKSYNITFKKPGYADQTQILSNSVGTHWVVLDVLGGLLPIVIDAATGSWYQFNSDVVGATLSPERDTATANDTL
jgi:hypothetical protein